MLGDWHPNIYVFASLSAVVTGLSIATFVLFRGRGVPAARSLVLMATSASLWCLFPVVSSLPLAESTLLRLARLTYIPGSFCVAAFLHLAFAVSEDERIYLRRCMLTLAYVVATLFIILHASPYFIQGLIRYAPHFAVIGGPLYHLFVGFYFLTASYAVWIAFRNFRLASTAKRNQLKYFVAASGIISVSPLLHFGGSYFHREPFPHDFLVPVFVIIMAYAILKHQLLDIRIVLRRSIIYSLLIACITAAYLVMVLVMERLFQGWLGYRSVFTNLIVAFIIAIFFNPLRDRIQALVDHWLFKATPVEMAEQREQLLTEVRKGEQMKAVATLAAGLAHEIKNPLASIKTFTEYLDTKYTDPEFREKFKRIVGGEVERMNLIVQQLLEFAKPSPPKLVPVEVPRLLDDTLELLNNDLLQRKVRIIRSYAPAPPVLGDSQQLKQVFLNLLLNSLQAMNGTGQLTLKTDVHGSELEVTIQDNGHGIPAEDLPRIFDPFFSTKPTGTGLGLAVVQGIVKEHGGRIQITSELGKGTTVSVMLPKCS